MNGIREKPKSESVQNASQPTGTWRSRNEVLIMWGRSWVWD